MTLPMTAQMTAEDGTRQMLRLHLAKLQGDVDEEEERRPDRRQRYRRDAKAVAAAIKYASSP